MKEAIANAQDWCVACLEWVRRQLRKRLKGDSAHGAKRVLVHEILSIQVLSAALFGGLQIGMSQDNVTRRLAPVYQ